MRRKFTFFPEQMFIFLAIIVKCLKKKNCRMNLVYSEFKFVPKNDKKKIKCKLKNITFYVINALCKMNVLV